MRNGAMQKIICGLLCSLMLVFCTGMYSLAASDSGNKTKEEPKIDLQTQTNVLNAVTNVAVINSAKSVVSAKAGGAQTVFAELGSRLEIISSDASQGGSFSGLITETAAAGVVTAVHIDSLLEATNLISAIEAAGVRDIIVVSADYNLITLVRSVCPKVVGMVDFTSVTEKQKDALSQMARTANACGASGVMLSAGYATAQRVLELEKRLLCVWTYKVNASQNDAVKLILTGADGVVTDIPDVVSQFIISGLPAGTVTRTSLVAAHRGVPAEAPENTVSGFKLAIEQGADMLETDIQLTKDNRLVLMHDDTLDRVCDEKGKVSSKTLEELKKVHVWGADGKFKETYPDETVASLTELFDLIADNDVRLLVEIKSSDAAVPALLCTMIYEYGYEDRVSVISFYYAQIDRVRTLMPYLSTSLLAATPTEVTKDTTVYDSIAAAAAKMQQYNSSGDVECTNLTRNILAAYRNRGMYIMSWTYAKGNKNLTAMENAFLWGVPAVTTNNPAHFASMPLSVTTSASLSIAKKKETAVVAATVRLYGGKTVELTTKNKDDFKIVLLSGDEIVSISGLTVTALKKSGSATFLVTYGGTTPAGQKYTVCSLPVTVTVGKPVAASAGDNKEDEGTESSSIFNQTVFFKEEKFDPEQVLADADIEPESVLGAPVTKADFVAFAVSAAVTVSSLAYVGIRSRRRRRSR